MSDDGQSALDWVNTFLDEAMDALDVSERGRARLRHPRRSLEFRLTGLDGDSYPAYRVQHSDTLGPCKGGMRFHPTVDRAHCEALASVMTWKCALLELPLGGGKGGVAVDVKAVSAAESCHLARSFISEAAPLLGPERDIVAPDVGSDENTMAAFLDGFHRTGEMSKAAVTGKPLVLGGSHYREAATGGGVAYLTRAVLERQDREAEDASVAIQGFGNLGRRAALDLADAGLRVVAVSDSSGGWFNEAGLDVQSLVAAKQDGESLADCDVDGESIESDELLTLEVDVLIPAALGGAITADNAENIQAGIVVEGANQPITPVGDEMLAGRDVTVVPDILANSGGVVVSYFEWAQNRSAATWSEKQVKKRLRRRLDQAWDRVVERAERDKTSLRNAAYRLAVERVLAAEQRYSHC